MARIPYPDEGSLSGKVRAVLDQMPRKVGVTSMIAYSPALAVSCMQTVKDQFTALELPDRDREVVILTVSTLAEYEYEWRHDDEVSEAVGISRSAPQSIRSKDFGLDTLTARERIIIKIVQEIVDKPRVRDEVFAEVREV